VKIHIVQKGDTLWKIAKKYGVNFEELKKMNSQLSNPDMIMPGMKIKVPTAGGSVKKETIHPDNAITQGVKKEVPLTKEMPIPKSVKEMPIKEAPIKEAPVKEVPKEQPIIKEAPKAPYTPKMPLQVIPEIDINNYYTLNMQNMKVEQPNLPPKPTNILPEIKEVPKEMPKKEVPKKEMPIPAPAPPPPPPQPVQQAPCEPIQEYCVPVTPILPGSGFCPPYGGFPVTPYVPYPQAQPAAPGMMPMAPVSGGMMPMPAVSPVANVAPQFGDESSSFMPPMPMTSPYTGTGGEMQHPSFQQPMQAPFDPAAFGGVPAGYGQMPMGYQQMPGAYQGFPASAQAGYMPEGQPVYPTAPNPGYVPTSQQGMPGMMYGTQEMPSPYGVNPAYGQLPYGYPQMGAAPQFMGGNMESSSELAGSQMAFQQPFPEQGFPAGTGAMNDCGCGGTGQMPTAVPQTFIPPTPPIYSAPYNAPITAAQPPLINPYGMGPIGGAAYGMPGYQDESS